MMKIFSKPILTPKIAMYPYNKIRPLTKKMIDFLIECHEREMMNMPPMEVTLNGAKGLINRRLLRPGNFTDDKGKNWLCCYITDEGHDYLKTLV